MKHSKVVMVVVLALVGLAMAWPMLTTPPGPAPIGEWSYSQFQDLVAKNAVDEVQMDLGQQQVFAHLAPLSAPTEASSSATPPLGLTSTALDARVLWRVRLPMVDAVSTQALMETLTRHHVRIQVLPPPSSAGSAVTPWIFSLLPTLLLIAAMVWLFRRNASSNANGLRQGLRSMSRHFAPVLPSDNATRLSDVAGCEEVKVEVAEFIAFLKDPQDYRRVNARMPAGVLMSGPPGTGKTLLARAIAGEAGVPFFAVSGSDFVEMFVGVGAARVRELFNQAKTHPAAIVFIDEVDAIGRSRQGAGGVGNDEREQTLNQLLVEMDGFTKNQGIVVLAASNRPDVLDKALLRPGRFDRSIRLGLPDRAARLDILTEHARKVPLAQDVDLDEMARGTVGFSGAELSNLINEAALLAGRHRAKLITRAHLHEAQDKILMGQARAGGIKNERERRIVAYHEAGHAIVARSLPRAEPVHKITIIPRGQALGLTVQLPEEEAFNHDSDMLDTTLRVLMGGRAAEQVALNVQTVGASNDFARATRLARSMVATWGMDQDLGVVVFKDDESTAPAPWSESWQARVDDRVAHRVKIAYLDACDALEREAALLEAVAQALLRDETLDAQAFEALVQAHGTPALVPPVLPTQESE